MSGFTYDNIRELNAVLGLESPRWETMTHVSICQECHGPIGGWRVMAPFVLVSTEVDWYHLDEIDTIKGHRARPDVDKSARFAGSVYDDWGSGSGGLWCEKDVRAELRRISRFTPARGATIRRDWSGAVGAWHIEPAGGAYALERVNDSALV